MLKAWQAPDGAQLLPEVDRPPLETSLLNIWRRADQPPDAAEMPAGPPATVASPPGSGTSAPPPVTSTGESTPADDGSALLKVVLADGSMTVPKLDQDVARQVAYLAREILPPDPEAEAALTGPGQLKVILEDGSVVAPDDPELQRQIEYLAKEILSPVDKPRRPS